MTTDLPADPSGQSFLGNNSKCRSNLFGREDFRYEPDTNTYICPGERRSDERRSIEKIATSFMRLRPATAVYLR